MTSYRRTVICLCFLFMTTGAALAGPVEKRARLHVERGRLMRGDNPYWLLAVQAPADLLTDFRDTTVAQFLNLVCARGGNSVVVDLPSVSGVMGPDAPWWEDLKKLTEEARWREMAVVLRMFPPGASDDLRFRRSVVKDTTMVMKGRWDVIYWIEGAHSDPLAADFKRAARKLLVVGPRGTALEVGPAPEETDPLPRIVYGTPPATVQKGTPIILPLDESTFRSLEAWHGVGGAAAPELDSASLSEAERQEGFRPLFDGTSLAGWMATGDGSGWAVSDGSIVWARRGGRYLRTQERFADFVLRLEWKIAEAGNSGVFIRAPLGGRWSRIGMEIQLLGDQGRPPHKNGTASVYDVAAPRLNASRPAGEWNTMEIRCQGPLLRITLNDEVVQDLSLDENDVLRLRLREGFIALQDHGHPVAFRNIRIKRL